VPLGTWRRDAAATRRRGRLRYMISVNTLVWRWSPERQLPARRGEWILSSLARWFDVCKGAPELGIPAVHSLNLCQR